MRCLIIDNYDSFTWNLADYIAQAFGSEPVVVRNDRYTWGGLTAHESFDCIVISPGPGTVTNPNDVHVSRDALEQDDIPVLGVCLGHQGLAAKSSTRRLPLTAEFRSFIMTAANSSRGYRRASMW